MKFPGSSKARTERNVPENVVTTKNLHGNFWTMLVRVYMLEKNVQNNLGGFPDGGDDLGAPKIGVPKIDVLKIDVPKIDVPKIGTPKIGVPKIGVPIGK